MGPIILTVVALHEKAWKNEKREKITSGQAESILQ